MRGRGRQRHLPTPKGLMSRDRSIWRDQGTEGRRREVGFLNKCSFFVCRACAAPAPTKGRLSSEERERGRRLHGQAPPRGSARLPNLNVIFTPVRMKGARGVSHFDGAVSEKVAGMAPPPSGRPACVRCGLQSGWLFAGCYAKRAAWGQFFMAAPIFRQPASRGRGRRNRRS